MGNELATRPDSWFDALKDRTLSVLPTRMEAEKDRFWAIAMGLMRDRSSPLQRCNPQSVMLAIYACAKIGLTPDPTLGHIYVVPFKGQATPIIGYKGMVALAHRHPKFKGFITPPTMVFSNDEFDFQEGLRPVLKHRNWRLKGASERGNPVACYLVADIAGVKQPELMWWDEIMAIRAKVRAKNGPWFSSDEGEVYEMAKKTVIRRASKRWPIEPELALANEIEQANETETPISHIPSIRNELDNTLPGGEHSFGVAAENASEDQAVEDAMYVESKGVEITDDDIDSVLGGGE